MEDPDGPPSDPPQTWRATLGRMALRLAVIAVVAVSASWLISYGMTLSERLPEADQGPAQLAMIATALVIYIVLIATPFVPGLEIGVALMIVRGLSVVPAVYIATVLGLLLAFAIGRRVPLTTLEKTFRDLRLRRAADMLTRYAEMDLQARQDALYAGLPPWLAVPAIRYRYLSLALLINMPGNTLLGGGGGLLMAAGFSRLFAPLKTLPTVVIAVLPLPVTFWFLGPLFLG